MIAKCWNNGSYCKTGAGYGIRISCKDRDRWFKKNWSSIIIKIGDKSQIELKLSNSFLKDCIAIRNIQLGQWMIKNKLTPWEKGKPPKLLFEL